MLSDLGKWLFDSSGLTAHGFCLLWEPGLIWTYAISDTVTALAYFSIPATLLVVARQRRDLVFRPLLWLFAAFILLCGTTHWLDLLTLWVPVYGLEGLVKALTASVSLVTAFALWWLLPNMLALPSPSQLREANLALLASKEQLFQAQKMEAVGQLTGGIAHDFNNLLQVFTGSLEMLEKRIIQGRGDEVTRYIAAMRQAANTAKQLTNRLLAFSRRQALQSRRVEPDTLVRDIAEMIRRTVDPAIHIKTKLGNGLWDANCDPHELETAVLNLSINARDAMPKGGVLTIATADLTLSAAELPGHASPGNYIEIAVSDTGVGMTPDVLSRVFEPFFTTKPTGQGTGLGLSQVYGFVRQSGGAVKVESKPDEGTTVRLYLPGIDRIVDAEPDAIKTETSAFPKELQRRTVLLVEDQEDVRRQIVEILEDMGCVVTQATDGLEGLRRIQSGSSFDLLITDVGLPGLNGRQLTDAARERTPNLPVLLLTGYAGKALDSSQLAPGIELLRKPFSLDMLSERVSALLMTSNLTR
jgi:signal transduction histidine kinase/CheY-like chemotaxis protein